MIKIQESKCAHYFSCIFYSETPAFSLFLSAWIGLRMPISALNSLSSVYVFLAYFPEVDVCDLQAVCLSVDPPINFEHLNNS
jgi:hypothetical protein